MMGQKIHFFGEIWLIFPKLSLLPLLICKYLEFRDHGRHINTAGNALDVLITHLVSVFRVRGYNCFHVQFS